MFILHNNIDYQFMSHNSNNLLQFLKKKDLLTNSPTKRRSSSSRSKERNIQIRPATIKPSYDDDVTRDILNQLSAKKGDNLPQPREYSPIHNSPLDMKGPKLSVGETIKIRNTQDTFEVNKQIPDSFWPQLVSYSASFQSARIEATKTLQRMGNKLKNEITLINQKLQNFNTQMQKVLVNEIKNLRQKIIQIVDEVFKESHKNLQKYLRFQQEKLCKDLIAMKDFLQQQYKRVEGMKEQISKPEWRKVTGKIIANEEERKIEQICKKSSTIDVNKWHQDELIGYRIKEFQRDLRDALHLGKIKQKDSIFV